MSEDLPLISPELTVVLKTFEPIELEALLEGAQMERIDRKFPFHISRISEVLSGLDNDYKIVRAAGSFLSPYDSQYFDTEDFRFYARHHSGFLNRHKIRYRSYPRTQTTFLEVKRKSNKGRTAKSRILCKDLKFPLTADGLKFIKESVLNIDPKDLIPSVFMKYHRIAFTANDGGYERFSIDFGINGRLGTQNVDFGDLAILEVKQDCNFTSPIIAKLRDLRLGEASMSKYCLALALLNPNLKANRFKSALRRMEKIIHEED